MVAELEANADPGIIRLNSSSGSTRSPAAFLVSKSRRKGFMGSYTPFDNCSARFRPSTLFSIAAVVLIAALAAGCGGSGGTTFSGNTAVTVLASSTANDQLVQVSLNFTGLALTSQSGTTVSLLTTPVNEEFIHVNGTAEPLFTASVPQGVYTSAAATIGGAQFSCATLLSDGGLDNSTYAYGATPSSQVTVKLPSPIKVTGDAMGLVLDLLVSVSATDASCAPNGISAYSITPTFNLAPVAFSSQPANSGNGKLTGLNGIVASAGASGSSFTVTTQGDGPSWSVNTTGSTVYQGINGPSALIAGMPMDVDVAVQPDGSLLATRVEVDNADAANLSAWKGPLEFVGAADPVLFAGAVEEQGFLFNSAYLLGGAGFTFGNAAFQTSGQLTNIQSLPFPAAFTAANMVPGQNVSVTTNALSFAGDGITSATVTLEPQAINGTVSTVSNEGGFTTYTVSLAPYDLFPDLALQQGQASLLTDPNSVVVYVDGNTQLLNTEPIAAGSVMRFLGLVFNDNGTLRMDCAQVNDGVTE
jgi:hypothetical protein